MPRHRDRPPLDQVIQERLIAKERRSDGRCLDCGNWPDGKDVSGNQELDSGVIDLKLDAWLCWACHAIRTVANDNGQDE